MNSIPTYYWCITRGWYASEETGELLYHEFTTADPISWNHQLLDLIEKIVSTITLPPSFTSLPKNADITLLTSVSLDYFFNYYDDYKKLCGFYRSKRRKYKIIDTKSDDKEVIIKAKGKIIAKVKIVRENDDTKFPIEDINSKYWNKYVWNKTDQTWHFVKDGGLRHGELIPPPRTPNPVIVSRSAYIFEQVVKETKADVDDIERYCKTDWWKCSFLSNCGYCSLWNKNVTQSANGYPVSIEGCTNV